ncbi:choice-of-anchor L domain-containing protein [Enhygromyxa salina]|uniref:Uncharacterized protein n=1 Tax=Enhygromyxa salina TaxID=215803 RepID=A0A2S9YRS5_9BACT|nr:choice-of-anchor L domain-containing protein [Enhygromyxa salina]PRQ07778.1 hypothetical protein ENSA7_24500 [Enhygromyxa salina]
MRRGIQLAVLSLVATGCELSTVVGVRDQPSSEGAPTSGDSPMDLPALDVPDGECAPPAPLSCDAASDDPLQVVGLDCVGGTPAAGGSSGPAGAIAAHLGALGPYEVREGEKFLIMSTGLAGHLALSLAELEGVCSATNWPDLCPSTEHGSGPSSLPAPLNVEPVDETLTCVDDPSLVGSGDCSNSLFEQWSACGGGCEVWDYAELRVGLTVPEHTYGLAFDFAFMSVEWPDFVGGGFNDMFVAWLESESWTGNAAFDDAGNPITVNAGFTDYTGDELDGFGMEGHAGTRWLTTGFGVTPGETVQLVLAVFDLTDDDYDSVALLDGFRWTCSGAPPTTQPVP